MINFLEHCCNVEQKKMKILYGYRKCHKLKVTLHYTWDVGCEDAQMIRYRT